MSEWETFCDRSYYDLWRVRRKNERGFNDGYHIHNGEEARALVELLNGIESERDSIQSKLSEATEEIEELQEQLNAYIMLDKMAMRKFMRELEEERNESFQVQAWKKLIEQERNKMRGL